MTVPADFPGTSRFEIVRRLGQGGMGIVYEAFDRDRRSRVALKTLRRLDPATLYRFKQEFRALASIAHPNLIPLHELVIDGDSCFFTMELLDGACAFDAWLRPRESVPPPATPADGEGDETLVADEPPAAPAEGGERRTTPPRAAATDLVRLRTAFGELAEGVDALHRRDKLHRDLKPANVMVRSSGRVTILDFGLVAELGAAGGGVSLDAPSSGPVATSTDASVSGTPAFMSPEQVMGAPLGAASDWYAVGVMLFEALTGRMPYEGSWTDVIMRKQFEDAPAPSSLASGVPEDLDRLTLALLAREPSARPSGAAILAVLGRAPGSPNARPLDVNADTLVGREALRDELLAALSATASGVVVRRLRGPSGAGKTALLASVLEGAAASVVLRGRCHEHESVPFKALDGLVDSLTHVLVRDGMVDQEDLAPDRLPLLARMFPVVGRICTPSHQALDAATLRARACEALAGTLVKLGAGGMVLVHVDDLQWSDAEGAELLGRVVGDVARLGGHVGFLLAHRSEYEDRSPGLAALARALEHAGVPSVTLDVGPLSAVDARSLAHALLGDAATDARAAWIADASMGLPWFVHELARAVRAGVADETTTKERALELRAASLSAPSRRILDLVATAGQPLRLRHLRDALGGAGLPEEELAPLRAGSWIRGTGPTLDDFVECFHDRVREGVARAVSSPQRLHRALAEALTLDAEVSAERVASHFEQGGDPSRAAPLYEKAADEARRALAQAHAERLYERAAALFTSDADAARISAKRIHHLTDLARFADAYALTRDAARRQGLALPTAASPPVLLAGLARVLVRMGRRTPAELGRLPVMTDERAKATMGLLAAGMKAAYQVRPELCVIVANEAVDLSLKRGNTMESALGYMVHGAIFRGGVMGRRRTGRDFGKLALDLVERFDAGPFRAEVSFVVGYFATSWLAPATDAEALWERAYAAGLAVGDLFHTGCAASGTVASQWMRGVPLGDLVARADAYLATLEPLGVEEAVLTVRGLREIAGSLASGQPIGAGGLDVDAHEARLLRFGSQHFAHMFFVARAGAHLARAEPGLALAALGRAEPLRASSTGMLHGAEHEYVAALATAFAFEERGGALARARVAKTAMTYRGLARENETNFGAKARLLEAEARRLTLGRGVAEAYDEAVALARLHGMPQVEALAHRRAGREREANEALARWGMAVKSGGS